MPTVPRVAPRPAPKVTAPVAAAPAAAAAPANPYAGLHPQVPDGEPGLPTAELATSQLLTLADPKAWLKARAG